MLPLWNLTLGWLLTAVIVVGNGLVIFLITTRRNLRTTANWFVLSLAAADFCVGVFYYPRFSISKMYPPQINGNHIVHIAFCVTVFSLFTSMTSLCVLTLDRYLAIVKPLRYVTFMTKKHVALLILAAWSAPIPILVFCLASKFAEPKEARLLIIKRFWVCLSVLNLLACVFLVFATAKVFLIVRRITRRNAVLDAQLNFNYGRQRSRAFKTREATSAKMIGMVVTFFVLCYLIDTSLTLILRVPLNFPNQKVTLDVMFELTRFLKLTNSAVNPVIYALYKREIWRELKRLKPMSITTETQQCFKLSALSN